MGFMISTWYHIRGKLYPDPIPTLLCNTGLISDTCFLKHFWKLEIVQIKHPWTFSCIWNYICFGSGYGKMKERIKNTGINLFLF